MTIPGKLQTRGTTKEWNGMAWQRSRKKSGCIHMQSHYSQGARGASPKADLDSCLFIHTFTHSFIDSVKSWCMDCCILLPVPPFLLLGFESRGSEGRPRIQASGDTASATSPLFHWQAAVSGGCVTAKEPPLERRGKGLKGKGEGV